MPIFSFQTSLSWVSAMGRWGGRSIWGLSAALLVVVLGVQPLSAAPPGQSAAANPAGALRIEPMVAYNFIVDSNVETPATYAPTSAMLAIHVCNEGATPLTNVEATIGNFDPNGDGVLTDNSPGIYPSRTNPTTGQAGTFSLVHEGGSAGLADATRFIGDLPAGECSVQYWLVSYPRLDSTGTTVTRGIKPFDDLWLEYDFWATAQSGATTLRADVTRRAYMRNEISAMANKIWPNTTSKVPNEYLAAISDPLGWSTQAEDGSAVGTPGELITTKGVWFDLGNIGAGFDNDGDLVPDRNAWLQPVGDPSLFDAGCFRLVKAHGLLIIKLNDGTEELIEFEDQLYFEHIPGNNTGGVGIVQYDFAVLNGGCSATATPYQEVASGYDNEKFNFDFGQQPPLLTSAAPTVVLAKSAEPARVTPGQALTYTMAFTNTSARAVGHKRFGLPLVISDTIPAGTVYVAGSATSRNTPPSGRTYSLRYSTDHGRSWSLTEPSLAANITTLQWWLSDNLPGNGIGRVGYAVQVSNAYTLPVVPNVATASFGGSVPFAESKTQTPVTGLNRLTGTVFADMGASRGNGLKESDESGIPAVLLTLGIDLDNDGDADLESGSIDTNASGTYTFTDLMDGAYIVTVDVLDTALAGYAPTTPITRAVDLDAGRTNSSAVVRSNIDFGFAAALTLDKALVNTGEIYPGQLITFTIAANSLSNSSACITTTWAITNYPLSVQFFDNNPLAFGAGGPDGRYATANSTNPPLLVSAHHFPLAALPGTITKVEAVYSVVLTGTITDDQVNVRLYDGFNSLIGNRVFAAADLNPFSGFPANQGLLVWDVTNLPGVPWSATFISNTAISEIEFVKNGGASDPVTLNLDAVGIRVTTDQSCTALNPVSLQDSYDASQLEFVTATPSASSTTPAGTLRWNNIGPLTPGTPQTVTTVFRAKEAAAGNSTLNRAAASVVLTGSAGMTVTDSAAVTVAVPGSIGDTLFWDANVNGMQDWDEMGIGSVLLSLYRDSNGNGTYDAGVDPLSATRTTDVSGQYFFTNVIPATYFVRVGAITGTPTLSADPDADGAPCPSGGSSACDGQHRVVLANGERYIAADFGYRPPSSLGDTVWIDLDNDGLRDDGEVGLPFITVNLTGAATLSTTTDIDGYYRFIGLNDGNYTVSIDLSDPDLPTGLLPTKDPGTAVGTADGSSTATLVSGAVTALGGTACTNCNLDADFGLRLPGSLNLSGTICFDNAAAQDGACGTSGSGTLSPENPLSTVGARLYRWIDDNDNLAEPNELLLLGRVDTDAAGDYAFSGLPAARYLVSSLAPLDRLTSTTQTGSNPAVLSVQKVLAATENRHTIQQVVQATTTITNVDFAYLTQDVYDFGDLPAPYSTRLEQKPAGAYHTFDGSSTLRLGTLVDTEGNGTLSTLADGDGADEDGVSIPAGQVWINGSGSVAVAAGASGALLGWVDFDGDGDFLESSERVISQTVSAGTATYTFPVPNGTFGNGRRSLPARFRLFANTPTWPQLAMAGTGASKPVAGEVEDYLFSTGLTIDLDTLTPQTSAGGQVTYVVSVANTGTLPLSGIVITSVLPTGFTYAQSTLSEQNATRTGSTNPTVGAARPVWGTWRIDPAGRVLITQVVNVAGNVQPGIYDSDSQAWSLQIGMIDDDGLTAQDSDTPPSADPENDEDVEVVVIADLALDKSANTLTPAIGGQIVFTVRITNTGPSDAPGVTVSDTLPSGYTLLSSSATAGSYQSNSGLWTLGTLANGASARLVVTATVNTSGPYTNFAEVATSAPTDPDSIPGNGDPNAPDEDDEDSVTPTPVSVIDLSLLKSVNNGSAEIGEQAVFTVRVLNSGPSPATGITVSDTLPSGLSYVSSSATAGSYTPAAGLWTVGSLAKDADATLSITVTVLAAGSYVNYAQVATADQDDVDSTPGNNPQTSDEDDDHSATILPGAVADLELSKAANTLTPAIGGQIVFTVHITNTGPSDAPDVDVSDPLPSGYTLVSSSVTAGSYQSNSGLWTLGTLANGASARLVVTATVNTSGPYTNFAEVATSAPTDPDSIPGNGDPNAPDEDDEDSVTPLPCTTTVSGRICQDTDGNGLCDGANQPLANVLMTLIPQNGTPGKILMQRTDANGEVLFTDNRDRFVVPGNYLLQVQDAYLNNVDGLYPTASSLFFFSVASCQNTSRDFGYATNSRGAVGDLVWYDANGNGLQDEWYDANNDGQVTPNTPDANGNFDFDQYEWYDINNNGTYDQPTDELELRACGLFAANLSLNDNEATTISGILGYYRFRPSVLNRTHSVTLSPTDPRLLTAAATMQATGLCKSYTDPQPGRSPQRLISPSAIAAACALTTGSTQTSKVLTAAPPISNSQDLNLDYGIRCEARGRVEGTVYIDENSDGLYTQATDTPIDTVTVAITDSLGFTYTVETDANGFFSQSVPSGDTTVLVDELDPEFPEDADLTVPNGAANGDNTNPATVSVPTAGTAVKNTGYRLRQLNVTATPVCVNDIPYLEYNVTPVNFVPVTNTVTVRWLNAADNSVLYTYANQPLNQRMLWPEAVVDSNGIGIEWPGWDLVNNEWVPIPTLVRPQAKVEFSINPTAVVTVTYPQPTATCYTDPHASIGDRVWLDQNMDGRQDLNETGLPNIEVRLFDSSGSLISTTVSDNSGHYQFWITVQGAYFLEAMAPAGYLFSPQNQGDDSGDTDANEIGVTGLVTVTTLTRDNTVDFGIFDDSVNVSLGDYIWADNNFNGIQDGGELGLPGVRVNLYRDENDNGLLDAGDTYLAFRVTDASGFYRFTSLPTDDYLVHVDASNFPPGGALEDYTNTEGHQDPDDYNDTDDNGVLVTNLIGGYASRAATVLPWSEDLQRNPTTRAIVIRNPTIDFGFHIKQAEIGDQVWLDSDGDGQQDPGEPGLPGVAVALYNVVGNSLVTTTVSNGLGNFGFVDVPAGEYYLLFTPPASFQFTAADQGNDVIDSDPNPTTGQTPSFLLTPGDNVVTLDAGLTTTLLPASLGDRVWYDANQNGRQDTGEKGLAGVQVRLSREGALLATTATDSAGLYSFAALAPGNYQLEFVLPAGYTATASDQGGDDLLDSDVDPATGRTAPIALAAGQSNQTVDLGVLVPSGQQPGNLAAIVWYDANLNNLWEGEQGVPGILVQLFDGSNSLIGQAVTTGDGQVLFPNLIPGTYHLGTPSLNGYLPVAPGAGTPENSSQLDPGALQTSPIAVAGGATSQQQIGLWAAVGTASIRVLQPAAIGNLVWQDNNENGAQDTGEPGAAGATVMLYTGNGVLLSTDSTAADGNYLFPSLLPGNYYLEFVPAGSATQFSPLGGGSPALDSDADPGTGRTATITVAENELNFDVDAGMINIPTSLPETEEPFTIVGQIYLPMVATE